MSEIPVCPVGDDCKSPFCLVHGEGGTAPRTPAPDAAPPPAPDASTDEAIIQAGENLVHAVQAVQDFLRLAPTDRVLAGEYAFSALDSEGRLTHLRPIVSMLLLVSMLLPIAPTPTPTPAPEPTPTPAPAPPSA